MDNLSTFAFAIASSALAENEEGWRALAGKANRHCLSGESRWSSADGEYPATLTIFLPWQAQVRRVRLLHPAEKPPYPYWYARSYRLEANKGGRWLCFARESELRARAKEEKAKEFTREYRLDEPISTDRLRYVVEAGWEPHASIKEVKILGDLPPDAPLPLGCIACGSEVSFLLPMSGARRPNAASGRHQGETSIGGARVRWLWKREGRGNDWRELLRVKSAKRLVADVYLWRWSEIGSEKYFPLQITNAGVVLHGRGKFISILNNFNQDPFTFGVTDSCMRAQVGKRRVDLASGVEVSLIVRKGRSSRVDDAKAKLFAHVTEAYGSRDFTIPRIPYSIFDAARRAVEHLKSLESYVERLSGAIWFKQRHGRVHPDPERYEAGFVGFQAVTTKALWDWAKLTGDTRAKELAERSAKGLLEFQIRESRHPNRGAFWDGVTGEGRYVDFNLEEYVWIWTNARIAYYLLQMSHETGDVRLQEAALLALEWILRKRSKDGYWQGDKVDTWGRITGQKNTAHGVEAIRPLVLASLLTGKGSYLEAARKIASHAVKNFVRPFRTGDVLEDVQQESVDQGWVVAMLIENLLYLYRATRDRYLLAASRRCAEWLLAWQFPRTPDWARTPSRLDLAGAMICEDARGSYNFVAMHETMEPAEAWMDLYALDLSDTWLHAGLASLGAVVRFQHADGAYTDGAIPESVNIRAGNWHNWCWSGWQTSEIVHAWVRLLFGLANCLPEVSLDWETLEGRVGDKSVKVAPGLTKEMALSAPPLTECLALSTDDGKGSLLIALALQDNPVGLAHGAHRRVELPFPAGFSQAEDCFLRTRTKRLALHPRGDFAWVGCFWLEPSGSTKKVIE